MFGQLRLELEPDESTGTPDLSKYQENRIARMFDAIADERHLTPLVLSEQPLHLLAQWCEEKTGRKVQIEQLRQQVKAYREAKS